MSVIKFPPRDVDYLLHKQMDLMILADDIFRQAEALNRKSFQVMVQALECYAQILKEMSQTKH